MPSREKGYVYSVVKDRGEFFSLLLKLFSQDYLSFIENPQDAGEFGSNKIPDSIEFPGFVFDSRKEMRWYIHEGMFFITIISDEPIPSFPEVEGNWTRERVAEYMEESGKNNEKRIFLVDPCFSHIDIKSEILKKWLRANRLEGNAELFSRNAVPVFLTLREVPG